MIAVQSEIDGHQLAAVLEATTRKRAREVVRQSSAASTSGEWRRRDEMEVEAVMKLQFERLRLGLEELGRRQRAAVVVAAEVEAGRRLAEKEAELVEARRRGAELEEKARRVAAEAQIWMGVARDHEAAVAILRNSIECALAGGVAACVGIDDGEGRDDTAAAAAAEDEGSCCYDGGGEVSGRSGGKRRRKGSFGCRSCGEGEVSVLLLPCRHLCLCAACESRVDTCPVCGSHRDASMRVFL